MTPLPSYYLCWWCDQQQHNLSKVWRKKWQTNTKVARRCSELHTNTLEKFDCYFFQINSKESGENKSLQRYKSPVRTFPFQFYAYHLLGPYHMFFVSLCFYEKLYLLGDTKHHILFLRARPSCIKFGIAISLSLWGRVQTTWTEFWDILTPLCRHFY